MSETMPKVIDCFLCLIKKKCQADKGLPSSIYIFFYLADQELKVYLPDTLL